MPFEIPENWVWTTIEDIAESNIGLTYKPTDICANGVPVYRSNNIQNRRICLKELVRVNTNILEKQYLQEGDLLICARNGSRNLVGKCAIVDNLNEPTSFGAFMAVCRSALNPWIFQILNSEYFNTYLDDSNSTAINQVTQKMLLAFQLPIPPAAEQERIISKLKQWYEYIDEIEDRKIELESYIKQTKSKILDLAISGKLVSQDPNDEPAIELLKRINPAFQPCDNSHYENLPQGWVKAGFKDIYQTISSRDYQIQQRDIINEGLYPVVSQSSNYIEGYYNNKEKLLDVTAPMLIFGDHTRVVKYIDFPFVIGADGVKVIKPLINDKFAYYLLLYTSQHIDNKGYSRHFQFIAKANYCIPPLREQTHIVKTLETLFETINTITAEL